MRTGECKGCGAPIAWIKNALGNWQPVDAKPARLYVEIEGKWQIRPCYMPHHAVCPKADEFRKGEA